MHVHICIYIYTYNSRKSIGDRDYESCAQACARYCVVDPKCCAWTYVLPGSGGGERCCLKNSVPPELDAITSWTDLAPRAVSRHGKVSFQCQSGVQNWYCSLNYPPFANDVSFNVTVSGTSATADWVYDHDYSGGACYSMRETGLVVTTVGRAVNFTGTGKGSSFYSFTGTLSAAGDAISGHLFDGVEGGTFTLPKTVPTTVKQCTTPPPAGDGWLTVVSKGSFGIYDAGAAAFEALLYHSPRKVIRRDCPTCTAVTHREVFYKRLTPVPRFFDLFNCLKSNWTDALGNAFNQDFELYSHLDDALAGNSSQRWLSCNFDASPGDFNHVGFPRDCGPHVRVASQWNSFPEAGATGGDVRFAVATAAKPVAPPPGPPPVSTCTGYSSQLPQVQCDAWIALWTATGIPCSWSKTDPCSCVGRDARPVCDAEGTTVSRM